MYQDPWLQVAERLVQLASVRGERELSDRSGEVGRMWRLQARLAAGAHL